MNPLINSIYELAGLVQLSEGECPPPVLPELIRNRLKEVSDECLKLAASLETSLSDALESAPLSESCQRPDPVYGSTPESEPEPEPEPESVPESESEMQPEPESLPQPEPEMVQEPAPEPERQLKLQPTSQPSPAPKKRQPSFTLNDRFLFARELFGGDLRLFDRSMTEIAGMDSYEEAEDYFLYTHHLNPEDSAVSRFLQIVERLF